MTDPFSTPVADPLMQGGSAEGIKFSEVGQVETMIVRKVDKRQDVDFVTKLPKTWPNSTDPMHVFVFDVEQDGEPRSLWVRGNMVTVIREAVIAAGLDTVVNTKLTLKFDSLGTPSKPGLNPPKLFKAKVEKVAAPVTVPDDEEPF